MAEYTHTFELKFVNLDLEGEVEFNEDGKTTFKTNNPIELSLENLDRVTRFFKLLASLEQNFGDINKVEVTEK